MRRHISTILLIVGIILMIYGAYRIWWFKNEQKNELQQVLNYKENEAEDERYVLQRNGATRTEEKIFQEEMSRQDFKNGMMAIIIPRVNLTAAVMNGTDRLSLKKGPGLYEQSSLPRLGGGNVCIAAHNDSYFKSIYKLKKDDEIDIIFKGNKFIYSVKEVNTIAKDDWAPIADTEVSSITLTTCHPTTGNKQRIEVRGELMKVEKVAQ